MKIRGASSGLVSAWEKASMAMILVSSGGSIASGEAGLLGEQPHVEVEVVHASVERSQPLDHPRIPRHVLEPADSGEAAVLPVAVVGREGQRPRVGDAGDVHLTQQAGRC
ncbi:hypothetical protein GCM10020219_019240 [Nonomuraea dietziae]